MRTSVCRSEIDLFCGTAMLDVSLIKASILSFLEEKIEAEIQKRLNQTVKKTMYTILAQQELVDLSYYCPLEPLYELDEEEYAEADLSYTFINLPCIDLWKELEKVRKLLKSYRRLIRIRISGKLHRLWILRMKNSRRSTTPQVSEEMALTIPTPPTTGNVAYNIPQWGMAYAREL